MNRLCHDVESSGTGFRCFRLSKVRICNDAFCLQIFTDTGANAPEKISFFKREDDTSAKALSGFAEFASDADAMDALCLANNTIMENPDPSEGYFRGFIIDFRIFLFSIF